MKNYKLIATDFDGTLLNDEKKITEKTKEILMECRKKGYKLVGVTARCLNSAKHAVPLSIFDYVVLNNGAYLYDVENGKSDYIGSISKSEALEILKEVEEDSREIDLVSGTTYYIYKSKMLNSLPFLKEIDSVEEVKEEIARMNIYLLEQEKIESYYNLIQQKYENTYCFIMQDSRSDEQRLVVNPKGVNKKTTLEELGKILDIKLDEMIFFGDGLNDLEVIEAVGCGVAMGNALEEVKAKADEITSSNNEDGIYKSLVKKIN